jgi:DNA modification methylase
MKTPKFDAMIFLIISVGCLWSYAERKRIDFRLNYEVGTASPFMRVPRIEMHHITGEHPTVKPVELFARPMRVHTRPGDICLEPFSGSGTQIIAAEKTDRRCFAIEQEPFFCDVAVQRWEAWTGQKAKRQKQKSQRGR